MEITHSKRSHKASTPVAKERVSARDFRKSTVRYRDIVLITVGIYLFPCRDGRLNGPHMSLLNAAPARYPWVVGWCGAGCCFAAAQLEQVISGGGCLSVGGRLDRRLSFAIFWSVAGRMC